jgi:hypothetical protein
MKIAKGTVLFRAQRGYVSKIDTITRNDIEEEWEVEIKTPLSPERMKRERRSC